MGIVFLVFFFCHHLTPILRLVLGHLGHGSQTCLECVTLQRLWVPCSHPLWDLYCSSISLESRGETEAKSLADTSVLVLAIGSDCWHSGLTSHGESELKTSWNHIKTEKKEIKLFNFDEFGLTGFALAIIAGLALGSVSIPLPTISVVLKLDYILQSPGELLKYYCPGHRQN